MRGILEEFNNDRERRMIILGAFTRFEKAVHKAKGSEEEKVKAVIATYPKTPIDAGALLAAMARGGEVEGGGAGGGAEVDSGKMCRECCGRGLR